MQVNRAPAYLNQLPLGVPDLLSRTSTGSLSRSCRHAAARNSSTRKCGLPFQQLRSITIQQLDRGQSDRERVIILGSGWAGYTIARQLDPRKYQPVVVSPRSYFAFTPLLASTSVGTLEFRTALEPVRSKRSNVDFFQGWADDVSFKNKTVTIEEAVYNPKQSFSLTSDPHEGETKEDRALEKVEGNKKGKLFDLQYDKLIITVGCYSQTFNTPGVKEHAYFLKDVGDARRIRNRLLACFEAAALPTTSDEMRRHLLNFAIVGGGPTGIEFSAELHDIINEDLSRIYPELMDFYRITVYDVADKVLPMFDKKLADYAMSSFTREGIQIKTSHHVQDLRKGAPGVSIENQDVKDSHTCYTMKVKEEGEVGVGMVVWSTGLMMNPFIAQALSHVHGLPPTGVKHLEASEASGANPTETTIKKWEVKRDPKTGSLITDDRLRVILEPQSSQTSSPEATERAVMQDVYALGDCAILEGTSYPATAQVASQKAEWLAKRLNKGDIEAAGFTWKNLGVMAYIGSWRALFQSGGGGNVSGRAAWVLWRGAYLTKSVSFRNKILIPIYWFINWAFGRDISRF